MPFEAGPSNNGAQGPKRIAVIGGGISGLSAAHMLSRENAVVLFEAETRLGGHARTIYAGQNEQPIDTGFLVFNYANYPHLTALFEQLDVPVIPSDMSFGCSIDGGWLEYGILERSAIFAQKRNLLRPQFYKMLRDMLRFGKEAKQYAADPNMTVGELIEVMGLGQWFRDYYLLPMSGAIWSTPCAQISEFPAYALVNFFDNHRLLSDGSQHTWYTVKGGSIEYVSRLEARLRGAGVDVRLNAAPQSVRRIPGGVEIKTMGGGWELFDEVVFGTHSDDSLRMLADPSEQESAALGAVKYQPNFAITHTDTAVMPKRRAVWSSWNYTEAPGRKSDVIDLTYWINRLQSIPGDTEYLVTLNSQQPIREELILDRADFRHPVFDGPALAAQEAIRGFNGAQNTWFCGAWMKNGFHEDGIGSAVEAMTARAARKPEKLAAE